LRKLAICVFFTLVALSPTAALAHSRPHHGHRHHPGCQSHRCDHRVDIAWGRRHHLQWPRPSAEGLAGTASWFDDAGGTACGSHLANGFAHLPETGWACGTRVEFCYAGRCVVGEREDSGPYVEGRLFDLTPGLKAALSCSDLCHLHWRRL